MILDYFHSYINSLIKSLRKGKYTYILSNINYLASGRTSSPLNERRFCNLSLSRMVVSELCSQQSAIIAVTLPSSSCSSYAFMKWKVTNRGTSTLATCYLLSTYCLCLFKFLVCFCIWSNRKYS